MSLAQDPSAKLKFKTIQELRDWVRGNTIPGHPLLGTKEVAKLCGVSLDWVWAQVRVPDWPISFEDCVVRRPKPKPKKKYRKRTREERSIRWSEIPEYRDRSGPSEDPIECEVHARTDEIFRPEDFLNEPGSWLIDRWGNIDL